MDVGNYLMDQDGGGAIALSGLSRPWPEFPIAMPKRQVSENITLAGFDSGTQTVIPPNRIVYDFGMAPNDADLTVHVPFVTGNILDQILALQRLPGPVRYTADNYTSVYLCNWSANPIEIVPMSGFSDMGMAETENGGFGVTLHLLILARIS